MSDAKLDGWLGSEADRPVFIVTAGDDRRLAGCLVSFASECSIDPQRFIVFLSTKNLTYRVAKDSEVLAVHAVPPDQRALAELFGGETGDDIEKFERCRWRAGPEGVPLLEDCTSWFAGRIVARIDAGDHDGFILEPLEGRARAEPMLSFHETRAIEPGHEP